MITETKNKKEYAYLLGVTFSNKEDVTISLAELERLAESAQVEVVGQTYQRIREITPATLFGEGKIEEVKELIAETNANLLIIDYEMTGSQINNISQIVGVKVIDRITLILDIFAKRATSNEGKLQVELAQLKYNLPRLSGIVGTSGRFGSGGVGMRGPGETKLETDKRAIQNKIKALETEIKKIEKVREIKRKERKKSGKYRVAIVGYTNAGKSTLLNALSKDNIYADDLLFATLDTTSRQIWLSNEVQIILTDTVGFISKLPHTLVDAFASTLEETKDADLILHIVDIANKYNPMQREVVEKVLADLSVNVPILTVYNKCDKLVEPFEMEQNCIYISAKTKNNIQILKDKIIEILSQN